MFIDSAKIFVRSGRGGNGIIHWRREKYVPKGGPDGGNGGKGGDVIIRADKQLHTLLDFRYKRRYVANNGNPGEGSNCEGRSAEDAVIRVPCGTIITNADTNEVMADMVEAGSEVVIAKGGRGGKGNWVFKSSTNQAPRICTPGEEGVEYNLLLELKLLADVGLVGFPNAGKSTLISSISAAKPKIADYPFTTLVPNLGMVYYQEGKSFVVADIPGLIEGAHEGKGLGIQFLRHIERTRVLVYLIDCTSETVKQDFKVLVNELKSFNEDLPTKQSIVALTKADIAPEELKAKLRKLRFGKGIAVHVISAVTKEGIEGILKSMWQAIEKE
ncbi:MAG: GTPase ObgE [Ignavibacteriales bacterium]|nr:GTPase ObgE [Ignavibacteriales bacterium]